MVACGKQISSGSLTNELHIPEGMSARHVVYVELDAIALQTVLETGVFMLVSPQLSNMQYCKSISKMVKGTYL